MKQQLTCWQPHKNMSIKNILVFQLQIYETPNEFDLKTAMNLTDQYSSVQAWNMYLFPQWCRT